ncbi:histidine kinase/DNA gyrase B/HSP90-like ATPase [Albidovulum inexpectatum]|uniref:histidine kinase n=1 Tax=Albidovulum inexpectatum TaxID=196587 RepID=A0A2S5JK09_9RHOB|nr:ATP-binding protein [Albidovulum inexpectatum]PPB81846.1 histidine kinase/DNA gyrase B/HSP90-like ATPase [Albidovulum inexpectatum]
MRGDDLTNQPQSETDARMALLGHDLRAAVSDILGGLRLIETDRLEPDMRLQMGRVRSAADTLALLLEDALAALVDPNDAKSDHAEALRLNTLLRDIEMRWSGRAQEKGLRFVLERDPETPDLVALERIALERILSNLLSNAIKYTDEGAIRLRASVGQDGALVFSVTDDGPGFAKEALQRLFEFGGRPEGAARPGQGLGLHISHRMAQRLGGEITVVNLPDHGACVTLTLPRTAWGMAAAEDVPPLPDLSGLRVLVAEDSATNRLLIERMLAHLGAVSVGVRDGIDALERLERDDFDLALIDIEMPRLNGIEVMRAIRESRGARLPIVAITAYVLRANREAIYAAGADAILAKPLGGLDSFGQALARVVGRHSPPPRPSTTAGESVAFDRATFDRLIEIAGPDGRQELLDRLASDLRNTERDLVAALKADDRATIRSATHVLIALAGAVGARCLQHQAQDLNQAAHRGDGTIAEQTGKRLLADLDRLIHFIDDERAKGGMRT